MTHPKKATVTPADLRSWAENQDETPDPMWDLIFDAIEDPIFLLSTTGEILNINTASERFLNLSRAEILGKHCYHLVHQTQTFMEGCPFVKSMDTKKREHYEFILNDRWSRISIDPILDEQGTVVGAIHIISDIHDLLAATAELARIGKIIENTKDGILSTTVDGTITIGIKGPSNSSSIRKKSFKR
jgi:PAS domain S-box-containing protein